MNRLTNIFNRTSVARTDATAAAPASDAAVPPQIARTTGARNLGLPAPIGKREKAKRMIGAAFSTNAKPTELKAPVKRSPKFATSETTEPLPQETSSGSSPLAERYKALKQTPRDTPSVIPTRHSDSPVLDEMAAEWEHKQYHNLR